MDGALRFDHLLPRVPAACPAKDKTIAESIRAPRGTRDLFGGEIAAFQQIEANARSLFRSYGYTEIRTPIFEARGLFERSVGDSTDIVTKELYAFTDRKGRELALRPEGTASVVRAFNEHNLGQNGLFKCWYAGPMFRYERPQGGRYRQFSQLGCEVFGADSVLADVEIMELAILLLRALSIEASLKINFIGCGGCKKKYSSEIAAYFSGSSEALCSDCKVRINKNPLRLLDCKVESCRAIAAGAPAQSLCEKCAERFSGIQAALRSLELPFVVDAKIVRGLDYYTGIVFEVVSEKLGAQDAILGGGRYDELVAELGGQATPAIGFAIGLDRLASLLPAMDECSAPLLYVIALGDQAGLEAARFCRQVRTMCPDDRIELAVSGKGLKAQMRDANRLGARFVAVIGDNEIASRAMTIKKMDDGSAISVPMEAGKMKQVIKNG